MTYVEFFDKVASENISACLTHVPDRIIYIGDNNKLMQKHISHYKKVFDDRGHNIEFLYKTTSKSNLEKAVEVLTEIVETYEDCVFDITGGEEILTLALGIVYSRYPGKNIQIHRINLRNNTIYDCDKDGITVQRDPPTLSVEENVKIYGGEVVYGAVDENKTYKWDLNPDFLKDINAIWRICRGNVRGWNMVIGIFEGVEEVGGTTENGLTTTAKRTELDSYLARNKSKYKPIRGIIDCLRKCGAITRFDDSDNETVTISYKNAQVKKCLTKAGQALEMKVYVTAKFALDGGGVPVYDDALNGVVIDWDGEFHDEEAEGIYDTENEIDVMIMHDIVPVFISCKNGVVTSDELYKLNTVAERFGGKYSKKVLIATALSCMGEKGKYLRQRAKDMNIRVLENIQDLDDLELEQRIKNLWNN